MKTQTQKALKITIVIILLLLLFSPLIIFLIKFWNYMLRDALAWSM